MAVSASSVIFIGQAKAHPVNGRQGPNQENSPNKDNRAKVMNPGRTGIPQGKINWDKGHLRNTTNQQRKRKSSRHKYSGQRKLTRHR